MTIEIDTSVALRRPADQRRLVESVITGLPEDEANWIEWKSELALGSVEGRFSIARQVLGFANRHPDLASRFMQGCAYVVVGASPGALVGVERIDVADLDAGLQPYVGDDGPQWSAAYVTVEESRSVLVVTVEAPQWGDRIFTLRRSYQPAGKPGHGVDEGTVFTRRQASTARARSADVRMLEERLLRGVRQQRLSLDLRWKDQPQELARLILTDEDCERWIAARRKHLLGSLRRDETRLAGRDWLDLITAQKASTLALLGGHAEDRTADQYDAEVEAYLRKASNALSSVAVECFGRSDRNAVRLSLVNGESCNLPDVEVVLHVPGRVETFEATHPPQLPARPRSYGTPPPAFDAFPRGLVAQSVLTPQTRPANARQPLRFENGGSTTLTFRPGDVRPLDTVDLAPFSLLVSEPAGTVLSADWRATSTGVDGVLTGTFDFRVADQAVGLFDLIPPTKDSNG